MSSGSYTLFGWPGWGSVLVEAALKLCDLPYVIEPVEVRVASPARDRLISLNPLCEVPTLLLPGGEAMTESAAIMLHLADIAPRSGLVPPLGDQRRVAFQRWLIFLVAAIYPTFTYGDVTPRYVSDKVAQDELRAATDAVRQRYWAQLEASVSPDPFVLGEFSALDIYVTVMAHWRPGKSWFAANCPKLHDVAEAGLALPALRNVWARNGFIATA